MASNATLEDLRAQFVDGRLAGECSVPAEALCFAAEPWNFAEAETKDGKTPVKMRARSGQPIVHWYWGKIVHDMAGFKAAKPTIPIDYCHYNDEVLGYLSEFKATGAGLDCAGALVQFHDKDRTAEVTLKARAGVPYEASIFFDPNSLVIEEVGPNAEVEVNGYKLQGPALVVRKWSLRGVAVCPYGADGKTSTKFADAIAGEVPVQFVSLDAEAAMSGKNDTKPAEKTETKPEELAAAKPAEATAAGATADPRAEFKATLEKFTAKFGAENGAKWAAEGLSYEAALEKHAEVLATQLTNEQAKSTDLASKLAAIPRGEETAVSFNDGEGKGADGKDVAALKFRLGENLARFAAGIKLPGKN